MAANPTTDQYLTAAKAGRIGHDECASGCPVAAAEAVWIEALLKSLPDVDPKVVGQVLLHVGTLLQNLATDIPLPFTAAARFLCDALRDFGIDLVDANGAQTSTAFPW